MRVRKVSAVSISKVAGEEWVDTNRRPYVDHDTAWVPVKEGFPADCEIGERRSYKGRGYRMIGDIAVIQGVMPSTEEIRALTEWKNPSCILFQEGIDGYTRSPLVRVICGEPHEVCHTESGIRYRLDPSRVMFSFGNRNEKNRIALMIRNSGKEERVADMFAGIGYFSLPAALSGAMVDAVEINPDAYIYLEKNVVENRMEELITPLSGDCRDRLDGIYDRIIMGHFDSQNFIGHALEHARRGTIIHVHTLDHDPLISIRKVVSQTDFTCSISIIKVKKYAPGRWHRVVDVVLE